MQNDEKKSPAGSMLTTSVLDIVCIYVSGSGGKTMTVVLAVTFCFCCNSSLNVRYLKQKSIVNLSWE